MNKKYRTVILTDGEVDDMNSFIRYLFYSNDIETQGIILTSSRFHYSGSRNVEPYRWTGTTWVVDMINQYEKIYNNLKIHDVNYPTPQYLKSVYKIGNISNVSEMEEITPGSKLLEELFLDNDERPLFLQIWGGMNTVARALKSIEERFETSDNWENIKEKIEKKIIMYTIFFQDTTYQSYISKKWSNVKVVFEDLLFSYFAYEWKRLPREIQSYLDSEWQNKNIINKNSLLDMYALIGDGKYLTGEPEKYQYTSKNWLLNHADYQKMDFISEGDSLAYFFSIKPGLSDIENPTLGGWGGRFVELKPNFYTSQAMDYNPLTQRFEQEYNFIRWIPDIQNDFAGRVAWSMTNNFEEVSHYPVVEMEVDVLHVAPGQEVVLDAKVVDLNNNPLKFKWWCYYEASTYWNFQHYPIYEKTTLSGNHEIVYSRHTDEISKYWQLNIIDAETTHAKVVIPEDAIEGDTFQLIFEATNICAHPLKSYKRVKLIVQ